MTPLVKGVLLAGGAFAAWKLAQKDPSGPPVPPSVNPSLSNSLGINGGPGGAPVDQWFGQLPKGPGPEREAAIFAAFDQGFTRSATWTTVRSIAAIDGQQRTLDLDVMDDALCVGDDSDFIRVSMNATTQQQIADAWPAPGVYFCTSRVADLIAANAVVRIPCFVMSARKDIGTDHMAETWVMLEYHRTIEQARQGRTGLLSDAGKYWVASARLGRNGAATVGKDGLLCSANYGFYVLDDKGNYAPMGQQGSHVGTGGWSHGPGGWPVWQNVGLAHNRVHADYSQLARFMGKRAILDGQTEVDLQSIASDPKLCALISDEGPTLLRLPT